MGCARTGHVPPSRGRYAGRRLAFEDYDVPGLKTLNGVAEMDGHTSAWFKGSEGNVIELMEVE
jgi:hypothetical protein